MLQWTKGWGRTWKNAAKWAGEAGEVRVLENGSEEKVKSITRGWCAGAEVRQGAQGSASEEGMVCAGWPRRWKDVFGEEVLLETWRPVGRWTLGEG